MKELFQRIWDIALPYQDKRDDDGHARITLEYARKLCGLGNGDEDTVVPAIILHDIGWSQLSKQTITMLFDSKVTKQQLFDIRIMHQDESVRLAAPILEEIGYPSDRVREILEIISEHDTRQGFISKSDGLVRDADKLWRFSKVGFETDVRRFGISREIHGRMREEELNGPLYIYSSSGMRIASEELELRKAGQ